jgi:hypothetical protein
MTVRGQWTVPQPDHREKEANMYESMYAGVAADQYRKQAESQAHTRRALRLRKQVSASKKDVVGFAVPWPWTLASEVRQ